MENHLRTRDHHFVAFASHLLDEDRDLHFAARIDLKCASCFRVVDLQRDIAARFANKSLTKMTCRDKFSFPAGKRRIVYQNVHANRWRIDIHELKQRTFFAVSKSFADVNFLETSEANDVAGGRVLYFHLLQSRICKKRGDSSTFPTAIAMNTDDRIADRDATADDTPERNSSKIIAIIQVRHEHLKKWLRGNLRRRDVAHDCFKKRRHVVAVVVQFAHGVTVFGARINDREIELVIGCLQFNKKIENHVDDPMRSCVFSVDLIDDND